MQLQRGPRTLGVGRSSKSEAHGAAPYHGMETQLLEGRVLHCSLPRCGSLSEPVHSVFLQVLLLEAMSFRKTEGNDRFLYKDTLV